ncbi:hypothetical protein [Nocardioides sp. T2.26MG-1]|uniref:hypothetical protein n=1 Tax=Nocardioides sp. T2.26MG-1 TaxID=3041166 RepID=UPI002540285B|nr:hypothetical protein [Nocardioides sp. T2.26MG-1]
MTLSGPFKRDTKGKPIAGRELGCDDGGDTDELRVSLRRIDGIPGRQALVRENYPSKFSVYVRGDVDTRVQDLSDPVRELILNG